MTDCNAQQLSFHPLNRRTVVADFLGGHITSDAGLLLVRQADRKLDLTARVARSLDDPRRAASCRHSVRRMLAQRVYGIAAGYEDQNDHTSLRDDIALQTAVDSEQTLASQPTLCRFENRAGRAVAAAISAELVEQFIAARGRRPKELILDFDATDVAVHGRQEGRFFHGYYDHYCFLPLYVSCGDHLLVAYLRPSMIDPAKHAWAILALLVRRLRSQWPGVTIILRADSGFCRWRMLRWCERHGVGYIVGIARNGRLMLRAEALAAEAGAEHQRSGAKARLFARARYGARSWDRSRTIIIKAEHTDLGGNTRFLVTNLPGDPQELYDRLYCARGEMENRIKEQQLDLFAGRTSAHRWWPNQLRVLLSALAYVLLAAIRRLGLAGTELARATCGSIRLKLLKVGAVVIRNTRRILFKLSEAYPYKALFALAARRLAST